MKTLLTSLLASALIVSGCSGKPDPATQRQGHEAVASDAEYARGPHRGRLLSNGDFSVEITIFEDGVPPEFRVYAYRDGKPLPPQAVTLGIELSRLGGRVDRFGFQPQENFLRGDGVVIEPHSFDVKVTAVVAGTQHVWQFASYEGRTTISREQADSAGIQTAIAGPGVLKETLTLYGSIQPNAERVRQVSARFPGVIRSVSKQVGDTVNTGETLATVESNESLQTYPVTSPLSGRIIERNANAGESAGADSLFIVADYSSVWADLAVFPRDRSRLSAGQPVVIAAADGESRVEGKIALVAPTGMAGSQGLVARVVIPNPGGVWTPGLFVTGEITVTTSESPLVVPMASLQAFRDFTVVFAQVGDTYEVRMLDLGRNDGERVEVLGGLEPGTRYVTANSYLIKADIEKSGASHDH
jgi:membrane fusion protein, heavy metal efflux system